LGKSFIRNCLYDVMRHP